ncbi:hypothetical protein APL35_gp109 [Apis mellifera filamentous virus]|uniref:hypothetical protein n=1 Tax=Apis mellifera filamentous virus TaxID=1100043 RepID=UPI0006BC7C04|nr:hypothetical protein APL35_gp109 [Apis mellifera filamentous virus]
MTRGIATTTTIINILAVFTSVKNNRSTQSIFRWERGSPSTIGVDILVIYAVCCFSRQDCQRPDCPYSWRGYQCSPSM